METSHKEGFSLKRGKNFLCLMCSIAYVNVVLYVYLQCSRNIEIDFALWHTVALTLGLQWMRYSITCHVCIARTNAAIRIGIQCTVYIF